MGDYWIRGILIGLLFGVPAGAVGAMTAQRTLNYGMKAGLLTGLGSSAADCVYACVAAFGLTLISDFLTKYQRAIHVAGGSLVLWMGLRLLRTKNGGLENAPDRPGGLRMFCSSFAVGIANPAAILTFLFAFSWFGISGKTSAAKGAFLVCGVLTGTYIWWGMLTGAVALLKKKVKQDHLRGLNRLFGLVLTLFGATVLARAV